MSPLKYLQRRRPQDREPPEQKPFPTASTFIGLALALIALWLLAGGLPQVMGWQQPFHSVEAGASK